MACSFAGDSHCALGCGSQAALTKPVEKNNSSSESLKLGEPAPRPARVVWETTQACDLNCVHCRVNSRPHRHPLELSTAEAFHLIDQVSALKVPTFEMTGGDPLKRPDILPIVQYAARRGVITALTPSTTPLLSREAVFNLKQSGLSRLALSLDASTAELHDSFRGAPGSYKRTLDAVGWCHGADLPVQVNTTISRRNFADLDNLIQLLTKLRITVWSVYFLVPTGRGKLEDLLSADEHELVFVKLYETSKRGKFQIKVNEGQHYRRFVLQQKVKEGQEKLEEGLGAARTTNGKGFAFVSHTGEVYPSGFLPLSAGNILWEPLADIYQHAPLFRSLRDPAQLKGKCGRCEFKEVCGGSRARAYAVSHDPLAEEPRCAYIPA